MKLPKELTTVTPLSKYFAMVLFISLPFIGFLIGIRYQETVSLQTSQSENIIVTTKRSPTPEINQVTNTSNWKTYNLKKYITKYGSSYNFSISYPQDWAPRDHDFGTGVDIAFLSPNYKIPERGAGEEILDGARIEISVIPNQEFIDLSEWVKNFYYDPIKKRTFVNPRKAKIGNRDILEFEWQDKDSGKIDMIMPHKFHTKVFAEGNTIYVFQVVAKSLSQEYILIMNQILSTFQFAD